MWEFSTEPEFQEKLDWTERFVREEVEPLDLQVASVEPLAAADAHRLGLVNMLTEPGKALHGAGQLAARIAVNGPLAVAATK
jgi:hypothetical protein